MHAYIIAGIDKETRDATIRTLITQWGVAAVDVIDMTTDEDAIGIAAVREFQKRLMLKPFASSYTVGVIHGAHRLTTEAQHALLKTLEEPPNHARILMETEHPSLFLPTICSRCFIIDDRQPARDTGEQEAAWRETLLMLRQSGIAERLAFIDTISATRKDAKAWVHGAITTCRKLLLAKYQHKGTMTDTNPLVTSAFLRNLLTAAYQLDANVNSKLVLDAVLLADIFADD